MSDDPFHRIMHDRGLGDAEPATDEVPWGAGLPMDYAARVRALELAVGMGTRDRKEIVATATEFLAFLIGKEKV
jgi:hypothetical protein